MPCARCGCTCGSGDGAVAEALREEEEGYGQQAGHAAAPTVAAQADTTSTTKKTTAALTTHHDVEIERRYVEFQRASRRAGKAILRGLIVLPWLYLVDLMRTYVATKSTEELILATGPLSILALVVSILFFMMMEGLDECIPPITPP
ncbi:hypothetical protein BS78_05G094800 [Paspalum vaginatum]|nr:hypothetical protein BS78_05G094800 [Paspalum vaginatum]